MFSLRSSSISFVERSNELILATQSNPWFPASSDFYGSLFMLECKPNAFQSAEFEIISRRRQVEGGPMAMCSVFTFFHSLNFRPCEYVGSSFQEFINFTLHYIADLDIPIKRSVKSHVK
jgi:hypothetical protein